MWIDANKFTLHILPCLPKQITFYFWIMTYTSETNFTCYFFPVATSSRDEMTLAVSSLVSSQSCHVPKGNGSHFPFQAWRREIAFTLMPGMHQDTFQMGRSWQNPQFVWYFLQQLHCDIRKNILTASWEPTLVCINSNKNLFALMPKNMFDWCKKMLHPPEGCKKC